MAVAPSSGDTVDVASTDRFRSGPESEPGNSTSAHGSDVSFGRCWYTGILGCEQVNLAIVDVEVGDAILGEDVVSKEGEWPISLHIERGIPREGLCGRCTWSTGFDAVLEGWVKVERHLGISDHIRSEIVPFFLRKGSEALFGIEIGDVVEHRKGTGCGRGGADTGTGVVLDAETKSNVLELQSLCWCWKFRS